MNISGEKGFAYRFSKDSRIDQDIINELFLSIDSVSGITHDIYDGMLIFGFSVDNKLCPILTFMDGDALTNPSLIEEFLFQHGQNTEKSRPLFEVLKPCVDILKSGDSTMKAKKIYYLDLVSLINSQDEVVSALYKFIYAIRYQ